MQKRPFAKLFEFTDIGQVLVTQSSSKPEITYQFNPEVESLGLMDSIVTYKDFETADKAFELATEAKAYKVAKTAIDNAKEAFA